MSAVKRIDIRNALTEPADGTLPLPLGLIWCLAMLSCWWGWWFQQVQTSLLDEQCVADVVSTALVPFQTCENDMQLVTHTKVHLRNRQFALQDIWLWLTATKVSSAH